MAFEKRRGYAEFFDRADYVRFLDPADKRLAGLDFKQLKERGAVQSFNEMRCSLGYPPLIKIESRDDDPPDCQAFDVDGHHIGIEVTELIDKEFVASLKKCKRKDWAATWDHQKLINLIAERIDRKGRAEPKGGPYASYVLLIFTDEPNLTPAGCQSALMNHRFARLGVVVEAYLLMSYVPALGGCPFIQLQFAP